MNETELEVYDALLQTLNRLTDTAFNKLDPFEQRAMNQCIILADLLVPRSINNGTDEALALDLAHALAYGTRRPRHKPKVYNPKASVNKTTGLPSSCQRAPKA